MEGLLFSHNNPPPPPSRSTANIAPHICHHSDGVTSTMYCWCFKKENVILLKNNASIARPPTGRVPLTSLPRNARDFRPVFCPYFCYWPVAARHPGFQPLSPPPNLHSPPVQLMPRRTLRCGSAGGLVRLFLPRHPRLLWFSLYSLHTNIVCPVLWRSPLLLQIN